MIVLEDLVGEVFIEPFSFSFFTTIRKFFVCYLIVTILVFPNCGNSLNDGILKFDCKKFREQCLQFKQIFQGLIWPKNKIWSQWHHPVHIFFGGVGEVTSDLILSLPVSWLRVFYIIPDSGHDSWIHCCF